LTLAAVAQWLRAEQVIGRAIAQETEWGLELAAVEFVAHHQCRGDGQAQAGAGGQ